MSAREARTASLIHQRVETVHGGPHLGTDTFRQAIRTSAPVVLDPKGHAQLVCELESCGRTYNFRMLTTKERWMPVLVRALMVMVIIIVASLTAQSGQWVYGLGDDSPALRILGSTLTGVGVVVNLLVILWTFMSLWFWPSSYELKYVAPLSEAEDESTQKQRGKRLNIRQGHSVKLSRAKL